MTENDELKAEIAALKERLSALEARGRPSPPMRSEPAPIRDLTAGMSMPKEALREMATAVPNVVIRQIVTADRAKGELAPLSRGYSGPPTPGQLNRSGSRSPSPLEPPPGVALADKLMDAADRADRVELAKRLAAQEVARRTKAEDAA